MSDEIEIAVLFRGIISAYGTGRGCDTGYAGNGRVATMRRFERRLR
jgi:hypothetical protein